MSIARTLYSLLTWAAQPLLKRKLRRRAQAEPGYAQAVPERFGYYCPDTLGRDGAGQNAVVGVCGSINQCGMQSASRPGSKPA